MACAVGSHHLLHVVVEGLAVFVLGHIDEVDHDDAAHIAQPQLAGYLVGGAQVNLEGVCLLVLVGLGAVARVDVDDVQGLGVLDDDVGARLEGDGFSERRFYLSRDVEGVEDWLGLLVELDDVLAVGGD